MVGNAHTLIGCLSTLDQRLISISGGSRAELICYCRKLTDYVRCPLLGLKRTSGEGARMSTFDPRRTFAIKKGQNTFMKCRFARNSDSVCMSVACRRSKLRVEARGAFIMGLGESL